MQDKLVSIIMPTYKGSQVLGKAIDSVLAQSYVNIELIVIDDNGIGTDEQKRTKTVIDSYDDVRLKYIQHKENKNGSAARNTGIKVAKGEYLAFLDDDDSFIVDKIEKQIELFEKLDDTYGLVYSGLIERYPDGRTINIEPVQTKDFLYEYLACQLYVCSSTIIIRRAVIDRIGFWDESFKRHQDMEFIVRVAANFKTAFMVNPGIIKDRIDRNLPKDARKVERYRLYYIEMMKPYINRYSGKQKANIYYQNYLPIGKAYIKNKKIFKPIYYAYKSGRPFTMIIQYMIEALRFVKKNG